jgi:hypothetical protein
MMPWEKYAAQAAPEGSPAVPPWEKYGAQKQAAPAAPLDRLPPETSPGNQPSVNADSIANRILGFGEAGASAVTGALGGAAGQLYGVGKALTGGKYGTQQGAQEAEAAGVGLANKLAYQPRTETGKQLTEGLGNVLEGSRLQGLPVEGGMLRALPEVPGAALRAGEKAVDVNRAVTRTAVAPARALTKKAIGALPDLDPATKELAGEAHQMGFRLTPDQVYGNKYGKFAGELANDNPMIKNNRELNQKVFNQKLVDLVGGSGDKLTRKTYAEAMKNAGTTIGDIAAKTPVPINQSLIGKLRSNAANQTQEVSRIVNGFVDQIDKAAGKPETLLGGGRTAKDRTLDGIAFRRINSAIAKASREAATSDMRSALGGLQDDLLEHRSQFLDSKDRVAYDAARRFYAIGKTLEPLVAKAPTGDIPPAALLSVLNRNALGKSLVSQGAAGDLGKLADIGQKFLKSPPSSGTAERSFMQNLLTHPIGSLATGATAAATSPLAAAYNRLGPQVTQQLIDRPPR